MKKWYFPSWTGDFRLEAEGDGSVLQVVKPTLAEIAALNRFLVYAKKKGWTEESIVLDAEDRSVRLRSPVRVAGKELLSYIKPRDRTITAVKFESGKLEVADSSQESKLSKLITEESAKKEKAEAEAEAEAKAEAKAKDKPDKAASVARPTPCCPSCIPGAIDRASEVLLDFLTPAEHVEWARHRFLTVTGHLSGHRYLVCHRNHEIAQHFGRMCFDLTDQGVLHFHDWSVPPEEEVLAVKLIMQWREPWLRNEATCIGATSVLDNGGKDYVCRGRGWRDVFKNPFGGFGDGIADAVFTAGLGGALGAMSGDPAMLRHMAKEMERELRRLIRMN